MVSALGYETYFVILIVLIVVAHGADTSSCAPIASQQVLFKVNVLVREHDSLFLFVRSRGYALDGGAYLATYW